MDKAMKCWIMVVFGFILLGIPDVYADHSVSGNSYFTYGLREDGYTFTACCTFAVDGAFYCTDGALGTWSGKGPIWSAQFVANSPPDEVTARGLSIGNLIIGKATNVSVSRNDVLMGIAVSDCATQLSDDVPQY